MSIALLGHVPWHAFFTCHGRPVLNDAHTRRVHENAIRDFMSVTGIMRPEEFRIVTRVHIIKWRDELVRRT